MLIQLIVIFFNIISLVSSTVLKKYGSIETNDNYVIFESKEFNEGDAIHFKVKALETVYNAHIPTINYNYIDTETEHPSDFHTVEISKSFGEKDRGYNYKVIYFTIKKQRSEYIGKNGNYIYIYISTFKWMGWSIKYRKRRQLLEIAQVSANLEAQRRYQNQAYYNQNYQAQAYNIPVSQAQMNPVPVYPEQGYPSNAVFTPAYK